MNILKRNMNIYLLVTTMNINFQLKTFSERFYTPHIVQNDGGTNLSNSKNNPCEVETTTILILHMKTSKDKDIK